MKKHRVIKTNLPKNEAFFLTKLHFKYSYHLTRYVNKKIDSVPFAYISAEDSKLILGNKYLNIIDRLISEEYIEKIYIGTSKYGVDIPGYIPKIKKISYRNVFGNNLDKYSEKHYRGLSSEAKIVLENLKHAKFNLTEQDFTNIICNEAYEKYLKRIAFKIKQESKKKNPKVIEIKNKEEYKNALKWLYNDIFSFNNKKGSSMLDFISEDKFGERVHSIVTSVPSKIRSTILIDNEETCETDVVQSQPNIIACLLNEKIGENTFSNIVMQTDLYNYLMQVLQLDSREEAKEYYFSMVFGHAYSEEAKVMYNIFPDIEDFIVAIKTRPEETNPNYHKKKKLSKPRYAKGEKYIYKNLNYTNFSHLIQKKETDIFRIIWNALNVNKIRFIPVHDSIIVPLSKKNNAYQIMDYYLKSYMHNNIKLHYC